MTKKKISQEELKKVFGGIKSNILKDVENRIDGSVAYHSKYTVDFYGKSGVALIDAANPVGLS